MAFLVSAPPDERPIATLRRTAAIFAREYSEHRAQLVAQQKLIHTSPALLAREREIDRDWEMAMSRAFRERAGPGHASELRARVLAGAAIGVIRATMRHWFATDGKEDLARLGEEALACLEMAVAPAPVNIQTMLFDIRAHRAALPGKLSDRLIQAANAGRP